MINDHMYYGGVRTSNLETFPCFYQTHTPPTTGIVKKSSVPFFPRQTSNTSCFTEAVSGSWQSAPPRSSCSCLPKLSSSRRCSHS